MTGPKNEGEEWANSFHRMNQYRIGVDGRPLPPVLFGSEPENPKMQVRRLGRRIAGGSHIPNYVSTIHGHSFLQPLGVVVQVSVVIAVRALPVKLVNRQAARFAQKEFLNDAVIYGYDWGSARRHDIRRLMDLSSSAGLPECVLDIAGLQAANRRGQLALHQALVVLSCRRLRWAR
jgi:hypothetical protein